MKALTRNETADFLKNNDGFAIMTHRRPDGDTLGSSALLCRGLRQLGKRAYIVENPEITEKYIHLHEGLTKPAPESGDILVCVDVASPGMLPQAFVHLQEAICLRIDHHGSATSFTEFELVEPHTAACGEVVYGVLTRMGAELDEAMAEALYTAVSTDTGCFRYANTTAETFEVAAACAKVSKNLFAINQALFDTNSFGRLRIQGWMTENARFYHEGKVCICAIPLAVEENLGVTEDDMENISGFPRSIEGVKIAATLRQESGGKIKISVRAVPGYDASAVCQKFGGGGHKGAAGCSMACSMDEAVEALKAVMLNLDEFHN